MPEEFVGYSQVVSPAARSVRDHLPPELLPKLLTLIDELTENPDQFPLRTQPMGRGANGGDLILYVHPDFPMEIMYEVERTKHIIYFLHFAAPLVELKKVFLSYSHQDTQWLDRLRKFLKPLEDRGLIRVWDDRMIGVGTKWLDEIDKSLRSARMAIFLVTQDFLNSQFIQAQEVPTLLKRADSEGVRIVWIAVKASTVMDHFLSQYQAANDPKTPLEALTEAQLNQALIDIYTKIKAAVA